MALFRSRGTGSAATSSSSILITKPVGLAVDDLMVVHIGTATASATTLVTITRTGWTSVYNVGPAGSADVSYALLYKLADAADVAASDFTFTFTGTTTGAYGSISAFSGVDTSNPVNTSNHGEGTATASAVSSGITPTQETLLAMFVGGQDPGGVKTVSAYAIVTSNPTWTEQYDAGITVSGSSSEVNLALATGTRTAVTATGNATATFSGAESTYSLAILAITPIVIRPAVLALAPGFEDVVRPHLPNELAGAATILAPTVRLIAATWQSVSKSASTWLNPDKS